MHIFWSRKVARQNPCPFFFIGHLRALPPLVRYMCVVMLLPGYNAVPKCAPAFLVLLIRQRVPPLWGCVISIGCHTANIHGRGRNMNHHNGTKSPKTNKRIHHHLTIRKAQIYAPKEDQISGGQCGEKHCWKGNNIKGTIFFYFANWSGYCGCHASQLPPFSEIAQFSCDGLEGLRSKFVSLSGFFFCVGLQIAGQILFMVFMTGRFCTAILNVVPEKEQDPLRH